MSLKLPDLNSVSALVHEDWMAGKKAAGITSRLSTWDEELMVPYAQLSEKAKELDRSTVRTVFKAISMAYSEVV